MCPLGPILGLFSPAASDIAFQQERQERAAPPWVYTVSCRKSATAGSALGAGGPRFESGRPD